MDLFLVRHGKAARPTITEPSDYTRPLTSLGHREMHKIGRALQRMNIRPEILATSPLLRTAQTADIISEYLEADVEKWNILRPESSATATINLIQSYHADSIMLVGHKPHLMDVISYLISDGDAILTLKKGGVACVRITEHGFSVLRYLLTPKQLVMMS